MRVGIGGIIPAAELHRRGHACVTQFIARAWSTEDPSDNHSAQAQSSDGLSPSVTGPLRIVNFTKIIFDHPGFPQDKGEHLADGWKANYWEPLEKYLSWAGRSIFSNVAVIVAIPDGLADNSISLTMGMASGSRARVRARGEN